MANSGASRDPRLAARLAQPSPSAGGDNDQNRKRNASRSPAGADPRVTKLSRASDSPRSSTTSNDIQQRSMNGASSAGSRHDSGSEETSGFRHQTEAAKSSSTRLGASLNAASTEAFVQNYGLSKRQSETSAAQIRLHNNAAELARARTSYARAKARKEKTDRGIVKTEPHFKAYPSLKEVNMACKKKHDKEEQYWEDEVRRLEEEQTVLSARVVKLLVPDHETDSSDAVKLQKANYDALVSDMNSQFNGLSKRIETLENIILAPSKPDRQTDKISATPTKVTSGYKAMGDKINQRPATSLLARLDALENAVEAVRKASNQQSTGDFTTKFTRLNDDFGKLKMDQGRQDEEIKKISDQALTDRKDIKAAKTAHESLQVETTRLRERVDDGNLKRRQTDETVEDFSNRIQKFEVASQRFVTRDGLAAEVKELNEKISTAPPDSDTGQLGSFQPLQVEVAEPNGLARLAHLESQQLSIQAALNNHAKRLDNVTTDDLHRSIAHVVTTTMPHVKPFQDSVHHLRGQTFSLYERVQKLERDGTILATQVQAHEKTLTKGDAEIEKINTEIRYLRLDVKKLEGYYEDHAVGVPHDPDHVHNHAHTHESEEREAHVKDTEDGLLVVGEK